MQLPLTIEPLIYEGTSDETFCDVRSHRFLLALLFFLLETLAFFSKKTTFKCSKMLILHSILLKNMGDFELLIRTDTSMILFRMSSVWKYWSNISENAAAFHRWFLKDDVNSKVTLSGPFCNIFTAVGIFEFFFICGYGLFSDIFTAFGIYEFFFVCCYGFFIVCLCS